MIKHFACKRTEALFGGHCPRQFRAFRAQAERKLQMLNSAVHIEDLRFPPGNRLEKLGGDREGQWSIRLNRQWRMCFVFSDGKATDVEITDYH